MRNLIEYFTVHMKVLFFLDLSYLFSLFFKIATSAEGSVGLMNIKYRHYFY